MRDICEALQHVHELEDSSGPLGLVHRDLSPDNIIISTSGTAKLIDFGAARATARTPPDHLFVGRFRYAAPERIRHEGEDCRSDVYSAGIVLYECLTGARPFDGSDAEVVKAVTAAGLRPAGEDALASRQHRGAGKEGDGERPAGPLRERAPPRRGAGAGLLQIGAASKEREVTGALSTLLEAEADLMGATGEREAIPQLVERRSREADTDAMALSEVEMIETSGPIRARHDAPSRFRPRRPNGSACRCRRKPSRPQPASAVAYWRPPPGALTDAVHNAAAFTARARHPLERAVELFDLGIALRARTATARRWKPGSGRWSWHPTTSSIRPT